MQVMPNAPQTFRSTTRQQARGSKQERGYGGEWERISLMYRAAHPVCEVCHDAPADHVDHIIPFRGLADPRRTEVANLQSICVACHGIKTRQQA